MDNTQHRFVTSLRAAGYAVLPAPRRVELNGGDTQFAADWRIVPDGIASVNISVRVLQAAVNSTLSFAPLELAANHDPSKAKIVRLAVEPGAVKTDADPLCEPQAYRLTMSAGRVDIVGNGLPGLFYGVQTLIQLLQDQDPAKCRLPIGVIEDWPAYPLRIVHWDTKHHQDRPETLRRFIDQLVGFKINGVAFELEDKFEYPSHPIIGAPGAFTTADLQELVRYGLERHLQIIPNVQAPAHMGYVLKHDQFAHLRCDGSNYQACMDDPEAVRLIFDMYDDVLAATPGVEYFLVSTDEVYYAGICEKYRKPYNPENRGRTWCDFANKANAYLRERGRRVIMWVEWPLRARDVAMLSPDIIDGIIGTDDVAEQLRIENEKGMRQLCYASMQGSEKLFPDYFAAPNARPENGRLADAFETTLRGKATKGKPIGTFSAAWDDSGLHNETFWLGWAMMAQCGWTPGGAAVHQAAADFMDLFYGRDAVDMIEVYRDMQAGARFWETAWERVVSRVRPPGYGSSDRKFPIPRHDSTLSPPALPRLPDLAFESAFKARYERQLAEAPQRLLDNDRLIGRLQANLTRVRRNRHNLQVFLSLAHFQRHFIELLLGLGKCEDMLARAAPAHTDGQHKDAVNLLTAAHNLAGWLIRDLDETYAAMRQTWEVGRFEKGRSVGGRSFVHVMDDVKDHQADRRRDLSYLIAAEQSIGLPAWRDSLAKIVVEYSRTHGIRSTIETAHE